MKSKSITYGYLRCRSEKINRKYGIDWIKIGLPCTVQEALYTAGIIDDPYFGDNSNKIQWIPHHSWIYRIPVRREMKLSRLIFHGVDYRYRVKYGGDILATHEGMFSPCIVDISSLPEATKITVEVLPNTRDGRPFIIPQMWGRKRNMRFPMGYGWDFAPRIITIGIWDTVELNECNGAYIDDIYIHGDKDGFLTVRFTAKSKIIPYNIEISVLDNNELLHSDSIENIEEQEKEIHLSYRFTNFERWSPWDIGTPKLYTLEIRIVANGETIGKKNEKFGYVTTKMKNGRLIVNDINIFIRGINWPPLDSMLRLKDEKYEEAIKNVLDINANLIRVWGGGIRERKIFYELTDKYGILVWQEFPFACEDIDLDKNMIRLIKDECSSIVKYIRNHPSIALICGGNELKIGKSKKLVGILHKIVRKNATHLPFHPLSPYKYDSHSWYVWYGFAPINTYRYEKAQIISEFGMQSIPNRSVLEKFLPRVALWPPNKLWIHHNAQIDILYYYAYKEKKNRTYIVLMNALQSALLLLRIDKKYSIKNIIYRMIAKKLRDKNLDSFIKRTQLIQAMALKIAIEHFRTSNKHNGCIIWQLSDPWPNISWSIIDHYGNKKIGYYIVKMSYSPIQTFLIKENEKINIVAYNDTHRYIKCNVSVYHNNRLLLQRKIELERMEKKVIDKIVYLKGCYRTILRFENEEIMNFYPDGYFDILSLPKNLLSYFSRLLMNINLL